MSTWPRAWRFALSATLLTVLGGCARGQGEAQLVITGATLIDGTGASPRPNATIVVRNGRIAEIVDAASVTIPAGTVVDAAGKYVIPGLSDMHVHFGAGGLMPNDVGSAERALRQFLYYGVTTVLNLGATDGRIEDIQRWRRQERVPTPRIYATGGLITVPGSHPIATIMEPPDGADPASYDWSERGIWVVRSSEEVRAVITRAADAGMDAVKIVIESGPPPFGDDHPQMPPELVAAAVDEGRRRGLPVLAHTSSLDELELAIEYGVHTIAHFVRDPRPADGALLERMRTAGTYYIPTLSLFVWADTWGAPSATLTDSFLREGVEARVLDSLSASSLAPTAPPGDDDWAWRRGLLAGLKAAHDAGVPIVAGTDTNNPFVFPGFSLHHELEMLVEAGLTPMEALRAATQRAAEMMGAADEFGTVEPGKRADLLVLRASPLEAIRNTRTLETVIHNGAVVDRDALLTTGRVRDR